MPAYRVKPPSHAADTIHELASTGFSVRGIAAHYKIAYETLQGWFQKYPTLKQAFDNGRESERQSLHNALYRKAMNGDGPAAMFLLKARHGYREGDQREESNRVAITFNLPGAQKPEEYGKVIDGNATDSAKRLPTTAVGRS
jgi:hypothetical protein